MTEGDIEVNIRGQSGKMTFKGSKFELNSLLLFLTLMAIAIHWNERGSPMAEIKGLL